MTESAWIVLIAAVAAVVLVALFLKRRLVIRTGDKSVETGESEGGMAIRASGPGAAVRRVEQERTESGSAMEIEAKEGATVEDARQKYGR